MKQKANLPHQPRITFRIRVAITLTKFQWEIAAWTPVVALHPKRVCGGTNSAKVGVFKVCASCAAGHFLIAKPNDYCASKNKTCQTFSNMVAEKRACSHTFSLPLEARQALCTMRVIITISMTLRQGSWRSSLACKSPLKW